MKLQHIFWLLGWFLTIASGLIAILYTLFSKKPRLFVCWLSAFMGLGLFIWMLISGDLLQQAFLTVVCIPTVLSILAYIVYGFKQNRKS